MVIWINHALDQRRQTNDYIGQDSPLYAKRVAKALVDKANFLEVLSCQASKAFVALMFPYSALLHTGYLALHY